MLATYLLLGYVYYTHEELPSSYEQQDVLFAKRDVLTLPGGLTIGDQLIVLPHMIFTLLSN